VSKLVDLTGKQFGRLTVLNRVGCKYGKPAWLCQCECGNTCVAVGYLLKRGGVKSCGCLVRETNSKIHKKYNEYCVFNDIVFVKFSNCNEYFLCDLDDWKRLGRYCWSKDMRGYAKANVNGCTLRFHRLVLDCPRDYDIDHIYQLSKGVLDNRKKNLRIATRSQNSMNRSLRSDNTSGYSGIAWNTRENKWQTYISPNKERIHLGYFDELDKAIIVRKEAEIKYFGNYAPK
jgi:hypothetical protein